VTLFATCGLLPRFNSCRSWLLLIEDKEGESADLERLCQGISRGDAACTFLATVRCPTCQRWFCDAHAEYAQWHSCMATT
jgi:hypothetical protein